MDQEPMITALAWMLGVIGVFLSAGVIWLESYIAKHPPTDEEIRNRELWD